MKEKKVPAVYCRYADTEKSASEIIEESFRMYLKCVLESEGKYHVNRENKSQPQV